MYTIPLHTAHNNIPIQNIVRLCLKVARMDFEENIRIGKRIASLRHSEHLTQEEMAKRLGKPQSYVSKIESGERSVHLSEVNRLSASLGRNPSYFLHYILDLKNLEETPKKADE